MRERWLGATGVRVPQIAVEGEDVDLPDESHVRVGDALYEALVLADATDKRRLREAHERGLPVVVRARSADDVKHALEQPEVACAAVPASARELRDLDLISLTYW